MSARKRADVRTLAEVRDGIEALTTAEWGRLKFAAIALSFGGAIEPDDLLNEALRRAFEEDGRKCPCHVDLPKFLIEAMRSIADGEREKWEHRIEKVPISPTGECGEDGLEVVQPATPDADVEVQLAEKQEDAEMKATFLLLFLDDPVACEIIEGIWVGLEGEELRELAGLSKKDYESKRTLMRRRIKQKFPYGRKL